jgi:hypothetical protein
MPPNLRVARLTSAALFCPQVIIARRVDEKVKCCIVVVLATRAGVHEAANPRALVSWPIGGLRACLAVGASQHGNGSRHAFISKRF